MLVSAIMPTRGRAQFAREALKCFLAQTWIEKELVIVDDADERSFDIVDLPNVQHFVLKDRLTVGAKRNLACSRASGNIICNWDDDDYSDPGRIEDQVIRMTVRDVPITGYCSMRFHDLTTGEWWKYVGVPNFNGGTSGALGTSLMYTREFWKAHPFPDKNVNEDGDFVRCAEKIASCDAGSMMYATTHAGNTSKREKVGEEDCWVRCA